MKSVSALVVLVSVIGVLAFGCTKNYYENDKGDSNDDTGGYYDPGDDTGTGNNPVDTGEKDTGEKDTGQPYQDTEVQEVYDTEPLDETCDESDYTVDIKKIEMLVVLDRSYSMELDQIWSPIGEALTYVTDEYKDLIDFGLMVFPSSDSGCAIEDTEFETLCKAPSSIYPDVALGSPSAASSIASVFDPSSGSHISPCGGTPIAESLVSAKDYLLGVQAADQAEDPTKRYVLLATDGAPNCNPIFGEPDAPSCTCTSKEPNGCEKQTLNCLDDARTYQKTEELRQAGFNTYVLGMGKSVNANWSKQLSDIALRGGTQNYYGVTDTAKLDEALETITDDVVRCDFDIVWDQLQEDTDKEKINFFCKESSNDSVSQQNLVRYDPGCGKGEGWDWVDGDTVKFCDGACNKLKRRMCTSVTVTFGCKTIPIVVK